MADALSMKRAAAGRKGGKTPPKRPKGFAANPKRAREAGRKGAIKGWENKRSALDKVKLYYELTPGDPALNRKKRVKK